MAFDATIAGVTLGGSLLSATASFCVLACFVFFNKSQRSFRHALVFNLALADFINATDNSISGIIYVRDKQLYPGPACAFNGWLGQLSVQATDFSVLAISIATLLVVTQTGRVAEASTLVKAIMCLSVWIMPIITSTTALALGQMVPVSGNWCWISAQRTDLRYALGHGWRFAIMFITIVTYTYIWIYITRHFSRLSAVSTGPPSSGSSLAAKAASWRHKKSLSSSPASESIELDQKRGFQDSEAGTSSSQEHLYQYEGLEPQQQQQQGITATTTITIGHDAAAGASHHQASAAAATTTTSGTDAVNHELSNQFRARSQKVERDIKKMLLLNGYPICYVILWIPGITNRIMEASGSTSNNRALAILQASTQFIGFANAVTYGLNQQWRGR
ncbi:G protein-coupled glucose receptor regulating Gpa2-domain-containing protein [Microdochium trichocladiopsis]|uniref:G protein-coupled glucose receptor regulating Gpa2-domain-containing protein n=1 Tax=Microdochium trichocladiopsis TaxID=1682393 RepID=A0A9P8Y1B9_9PEZI|nr:G protein-coupled glucose receptor regulating Gpa2-domain-containing protein [Microdochium trichocladiopsis]KAH7025026.1 G protein-coupled glucose receptor regulating Gpa2-domain-containing protein [Microdochium trichocladiopsis]